MQVMSSQRIFFVIAIIHIKKPLSKFVFGTQRACQHFSYYGEKKNMQLLGKTIKALRSNDKREECALLHVTCNVKTKTKKIKGSGC